jgi:hypothetical protein
VYARDASKNGGSPPRALVRYVPVPGFHDARCEVKHTRGGLVKGFDLTYRSSYRRSALTLSCGRSLRPYLCTQIPATSR